MDVDVELRSIVDKYVRGLASLDELHAWLASHASAIDARARPESRLLSDRAWIAIHEFGDGLLDQEQLRAELRDDLERTAIQASEIEPDQALAFEEGIVPRPRTSTRR